MVVFVVLLLGLERATSLEPVSHVMRMIRGTFSAGTTADYSSQPMPKVPPVSARVER